MQEHRLDFGSFIVHDNGILETVVDEGVELNEDNVKAFFNLIEELKPQPRLCMVNRMHQYSYTFKANMLLASSKLMDKVAVVKYGRVPWPLKGLFNPKIYRIAFFDDRNNAIAWLFGDSNKPSI